MTKRQALEVEARGHKIPSCNPTADIEAGELEIFREGNISDKLEACSAIMRKKKLILGRSFVLAKSSEIGRILE